MKELNTRVMKIPFPDFKYVDGEIRLLNTIGNLAIFLEHMNIDVRYDEILKEGIIRAENAGNFNKQTDDMVNSQFIKIKSEAIAELEKKIAEQTESERAVYQKELEQLKSELEEAHQKFERARSRAQDTKQGHVYIISNIGSFGEGILKIGMTRRMEPMDRVKELGDASVPFTFDVHALIESEDAPGLESTLHRVFDDRRVNKVNRRKEYFYAKIDDIEKELKELEITALLNKVPSADEYYQSIKLADKVV